MIYSNLTKKALILSYEKHNGQYDKANMPYIFHPFHIAEQMDDEISTIVALLHDVLEDTDTTEQELLDMGFSKEVVDALKLLTKPKNMPYFEYIKKVKTNKIAKKVKLVDLEHNKDLTRLDVVTEKDLKRVEKYNEAINILNEK